MLNHILVFSCGYNCVDFVEEHCSSIDLQSYSNYTHVLVDDGSTDGTYERLVDYKRTTDRKVEIIKYVDNKGSVPENYVNHLKPRDDDIVAIVDMDDSLADPFVLSTISNIYTEKNCWMTHGSFIRASNGTIQGEPYPEEVKQSRDYRTYPKWLCQHLRTFKGFLWNNLDKELLKDKAGEYVRGAWDLGVSYPMLEVCPADKVVFIKDVLYKYNECHL